MQRTDGSYLHSALSTGMPTFPCGIDPPQGTMPPAGSTVGYIQHPFGNGIYWLHCEKLVVGGVSNSHTPTETTLSLDDDLAAGIWAQGG